MYGIGVKKRQHASVEHRTDINACQGASGDQAAQQGQLQPQMPITCQQLHVQPPFQPLLQLQVQQQQQQADSQKPQQTHLANSSNAIGAQGHQIIQNGTEKLSDQNIGTETNRPTIETRLESEFAEILSKITEESLLRTIAIADSMPDKQVIESHSVNVAPNTLPICHMKGDKRPYVKIRANKVDRYPLLDSGSQINIISFQHEDELLPYKARVAPCNISISTVSKADHEVTGLLWLLYEIGDRSHVLPTVVMKSHRSYFIVGVDFWQVFEIKCGWGDADFVKLVKPWSDERIESLASHPNKLELYSQYCDTIALEPSGMGEEQQSQRATSTGMLSVIRRVATVCRQRLSTVLPKNSVGVSPRAQLNKPIVSAFETNVGKGAATIEGIDGSRQIEVERRLYENSPTHLVRTLLRNMPKSAFQIHEVVVQPAIRTATGANDSYEDVRREKHTCVSEPHRLTEEQKRVLEEVMLEFPYTKESGPLNCTPIYQQRINTGDAAPQIRKQYPMSPYILTEVEKEIEKLIERDIIEPINFSPWRWPILWVKKKDGGGRICLDARGLNKVTVRDGYPTLRVDSILQNLPKAKFITCLDMTQAFHQISIAPEDRIKTAFAVGHRMYCYKRATMGFTNSPADLAKVLDQIFGDLIPHVYHYVDDFIILSSAFEEHINLLREVAKRLREAQLTVSKKKSLFCHKKITFLGYVLTGDGLIVNPERALPILEYKRPETIKELRRLIGLVGWYRRFIPRAAEILAPLSDLTKGGGKQKIKWSEEAEKSFIEIKQALVSPAILSSPDYTIPYKIYCDASLLAGAAVLTQVQNGEEKVIAYHSAKFSPTQRNYSATERECLAVLTGVEKFRPFIDGVKFTVVTDHASLKWLQNLKEPHGKLARWAVRLQAFDIIFEHRPGRQMVVPDALSRSIELIEIESETETKDRWYNDMYAMAKSNRAQRYKVSDGRLYHMGRYDNRTGERRWALCVPNERIEEVLKEQHDAAHFGYWKSYRLIQKLYYWPNMHRTIEEYVRKCGTCKVIKPSNENTRTPTGQYIDSERVGRILSIDLVGPLPASKVHKHMWIIVAVDVFSKYVFAKPCTRATANVIAEFLEKEIFYRFDTPEIVVSDNGKQFVSDFFGTFLKEHKIRHVLTPVYHPQANPVEASNKSVKTLLRAELMRRMDHTDWSSVLARVVMRLNTAPRMPTGQTPHYIVFGREKNHSGIEHKIIGDENRTERTPEEEEEVRGLIYDAVAEEERAMFEQNKKRYNLRSSERKFSPGDIVYVKNQKQSSSGEMYTQKLAPLRNQAFIKELVPGSSDIYIIVDGNGKELGRFHANQLFTR